MGVTLLRHTRPVFCDGVCYGQYDLDTAESFITEASGVLSRLGAVDHLISSPLRRCIKLAQYISSARKVSVEIDERLMEMDFGAWEGRLWNDISRAEINAWAEDFFHARPHGGESVSMLRARALESIHDHMKKNGDVLIVTHAGVIKALLAKTSAAAVVERRIDFGELITLTTDDLE